jgi:hypothetical protein
MTSHHITTGFPRHIQRWLLGSPSHHAGSTTPFWQQTNRSPNWRSRHYNRTGPRSHTLQQLLGIPYRHAGNTTPSCPQTSQSPNLRSPHCNHMALPQLLLDNPFHEFDNTTPFCPQTTRPPNLRSHLRNCMDPQVLLASPVAVAQISAEAPRLEAAEAASLGGMGIPHGGAGNTNSSCKLSTGEWDPLRNLGQPVPLEWVVA